MTHIILIISGSIAAYKSIDLIRQCKIKHIQLDVVLTKAAESFITPMSVAGINGKPVYNDLFSLKDEMEMGHIALARQADLVVVAPASADILAKMTYGIVDDLASAILLATRSPVLVAPAMNVAMWEHKATQRNIKQLIEDGVHFVGPIHGELACGEEGYGRMVEVETILSQIEHQLAPISSGST